MILRLNLYLYQGGCSRTLPGIEPSATIKFCVESAAKQIKPHRAPERHTRTRANVWRGVENLGYAARTRLAADEFFAQFKVDYAIIGASAIESDGAVLDFDITEVRVAQAIIRNAREVCRSNDVQVEVISPESNREP